MKHKVLTKEEQLNKLSDLLNQKGTELDGLIAANYELWERLKKDKDLDVSSITQKREKITQNLLKIERNIDDVMHLNHGFKEHLQTDKIVHVAREIGERATKLFESFEKVVDLLNFKKDGITENIHQIQAGTVPVRSYIGNSY